MAPAILSEDVAAQRAMPACQCRLAADAGAARRPRCRRRRASRQRVAGDDAHAARSARRTPSATHCATDRLRALALLGDAGVAEDRAPWASSFTVCAILRRNFGAADAVERRARVCHLDEACQTRCPDGCLASRIFSCSVRNPG